MLEATADEENGFQGANTVLVSSTVSPAAIPRRALNAAEIRGFGRFARVWPDLVVMAFRHGHFLLSVQCRIERGLCRNGD